MFVETWKDKKMKSRYKILHRSNDLSDFKYAWEDNLYIVKRNHVIALKYRDKGLRSIPESIKVLRKLRYLDLSRCKINKIPESFKFLSKLRFLDLSRNIITTFPSSISELNSLRILNLEDNSLRILPKELFKLQKLEKLLLSSNELNIIPNLFESLTHLQELTIGVKGNALKFNPRYSLAWYKLAEEYFKIGLNKLAIDCCKISLSINPNFKLVKDLHSKIVKSIKGIKGSSNVF
jgi:Leucine-rich repeat (LRR) protein